MGNNTGGETAIPVLNFERWTAGSAAEQDQVARELADACRRVGFVYLTNHGVDQARVDEAFAWSRQLFALPLENKMLAPHPPGPSVHRGYSWPGLEKVSQHAHREGADAEAEARALRLVQDYKESYEIGHPSFAAQPNQWLPEHVLPGFRAFMLDFYERCHAAALEVLRVLARGIGLADPSVLVAAHSGLNNQLRLLHYPPVATRRLLMHLGDEDGDGGGGGGGGGEGEGEGEDGEGDGEGGRKLARMPAHTDWGTVTLLFQDDCGGLQVQVQEEEEEEGAHGRRSNGFVDAVPRAGTAVLNVGDLLMRWTNDGLRSTMHRVTVPPAALRRKRARDGGRRSYVGGQKKEEGNQERGDEKEAEEEEEEEDEEMTRARYSIPYFVAPDPTAMIECLPACCGLETPAKYPPVLQADYARMRGRLHYTEEPLAPEKY